MIKNARLSGTIESIPMKTAHKTQFLFKATTLNNSQVFATIQMSCYHHCPNVHAGDAWILSANLKKPTNYANPGGFDYVGFLSSKHIEWLGTLQKDGAQKVSSPSHLTPLTLRENLAQKFQQLIPENDILSLVETLTLGLTTHVDSASWDLFRRTGTTHLIDISGEHIAIVSGFSFWTIRWLWKRLGLSLCYPAQKIAGLVAMLISIIFTFISGFAVPTQRALIACILFLLRYFLSQPLSLWQTWRYGLFLVLLIEPHAVKMMGFYFSFIAVAILMIIHERFRLKGIKKLLLMQLACLLGLMPLSLFWFSYASLSGYIANLFAIPWVGFLIVPLALFITALSPWLVIPGSVGLLKGFIIIFLSVLKFIDKWHPWNLTFTFHDAIFPITLLAIMLIWVIFPAKSLLPVTFICCLATWMPNKSKINQNEALIDVLDVGQGLAVAVRTSHHTLLYDTGMAFYHGSSLGKLVITPYLNYENIQYLDKIIISHPDLDHRGGLKFLQQQFQVGELIVNDPSFYHQGTSCHQYPDWTWDGIDFHFFQIKAPLVGRNNLSCVLQVRSKARKILLVGDIEKPAENYLIKTYGNELSSNVLLVPHHGSETSSSTAFLEQVAPQFGILSYGLNNRYHFPHPKILKAYAKYHIKMLHTAKSGMVRVQMTPANLVMKINSNKRL